MSTEQWLIVAGTAIAIAIGVFVYRRTRVGLPRPEILDPGWQLYSRPTDLEPPGTVFRIDSARRRYVVATLPVAATKGDEPFGKMTEHVTAKLGVIAELLGDVAKVETNAAKDERLQFEMVGAGREYVDDSTLGPPLETFLGSLAYRADNRYFVIRECRTAVEITYILSDGQIAAIGGTAAVNAKAIVKGKAIESRREGAYTLQQKFSRPMRIMFLPEEIAPVSRGVAVEQPKLGRVPVREPLLWIAPQD